MTQCTQCDFTAKTKGGLKTHTRAKHTPVVQRHQKFDLDIKNQKHADELVAHMLNMVNTAGWALLKQITEGNIELLELSIIEGVDSHTGEKMSEEEVDEARRRRAIMKEIIEKPQQLIDQFKRHADIEVPTYDPYAVDIRQFNANSNVGAPRASTLQ